MLPAESAAMFRQFLAARGIDANAGGLDAMIGAVLDFYEAVPAQGLADVDGDMLLFQYGVYDWGTGEQFQVDLTRQFMLEGEGDDDDISQLRCTFFYEPTTVLRAIGGGHRWFKGRGDAAAFVLASDAYRMALPLLPTRRSIVWGPV